MDLKSFARAHMDASISADKIIRSIPQEIAYTPMVGRFNLAQLVAHLIQSEQFALSFLLPAGGVGEPFVLPKPFEPVLALFGEERHKALSDLNLGGAQRYLDAYKTIGELHLRWSALRQRELKELSAAREELLEQEVVHPLVDLRGSWLYMCYKLFVEHSYYHCGQITQLLKELGQGAIVPFPFGNMPLAVRKDTSLAMDKQRIEIRVVKHEGELLFQVGDLMFDVLHASPAFGGGELLVHRGGELYDKTRDIREVGTHASHWAFCGLKKCGKADWRFPAAELEAGEFEEGDILSLEIFVLPEWDLAKHIRMSSAEIAAAHHLFHEQKGGNLVELINRIQQEASANVSAREAPIIRFRQSN
jgi:hypothetical protein